MRKLAYLLISGAVATLTLVAPGTASGTVPTAFDFHIGDGFGGVVHGPDVTTSGPGDTISLVGSGTFNTTAGTASGSLSFTHKSSTGTTLATGTITVTGFTTFQFYGCGSAGGVTIPANLCGGRLMVPVHIVGTPVSGGTVVADGLLQVTCVVGFHVPGGAKEGSRLVVFNLINFNKPVSGETLFVSK